MAYVFEWVGCLVMVVPSGFGIYEFYECPGSCPSFMGHENNRITALLQHAHNTCSSALRQ